MPHLMYPSQHVVTVPLWIMCVDLNGSWHTARPTTCQCSDEATKQSIVPCGSNLLCTVFEQHWPLTQCLHCCLQQWVNFWSVKLSNVSALALYPPTGNSSVECSAVGYIRIYQFASIIVKPLVAYYFVKPAPCLSNQLVPWALPTEHFLLHMSVRHLKL